jgi:acyl carrier protein
MEKKVKKILKNILEENGHDASVIENIEDSTVLTQDLGLDSFNLAQLTVEIESEFGVDIFENGVISTFGEILNQLK